MSELNDHYRMLLGLDDALLLKSLDLSMESKRAINAFEHRGGRLTCPNALPPAHEPNWRERTITPDFGIDLGGRLGE